MNELQHTVTSNDSELAVWSDDYDLYELNKLDKLNEPRPPTRCIVHRRGSRIWTETRPTELHECLCGRRRDVNKLSDREFATQYAQEVGYLLKSGTFSLVQGARTIIGVFAELFR